MSHTHLQVPAHLLPSLPRSAWAAGREQCWHFPLYFRTLISISGSLISFLLGDGTGRLGKVYGLHYLGFFCRILSVSVHHQLGHPCGKAWLEKWAFLLLQIHSLNTRLTFFRLDSQGLFETFDFKREQGKARAGTPHKNRNLWLKSLLPGQQLCRVNISDSCFSGKLLCPSKGLGLLWGHFPSWQWSTGGARARVQWVASWKGNIPPRLPSVWCCVSGRGGSCFCLP